MISVQSQTLDWVKQIDQMSTNHFTDDVKVYDMAVDKDGNVFVTGFYHGYVDFNPGIAGGELHSYYDSWYSEDPFIAKYDADGNYLWVRQIIGLQQHGRGNCLAVDDSGNVYVAGYQMLTDHASFLTKYTSSGTQSWYYTMEGYETCGSAGMITLDASGNLYYFDRFEEPYNGGLGGPVDLNPTAGVDNHETAGAYDAYIAKFTASTGAFQWAKSFGGTGYEDCYDIETDGTYIYVCGGFPNTVDFDPGAGTVNRTAVGNTDMFIARYLCSTGAYNYAYTFGGSNYDRAYNMELDGNYLYLTAQYQGTVDFQQGTGTYNLTSASGGTVSSMALLRMAKADLAVSWGYNLIYNVDRPAMSVFNSGILISATVPTGTFDFNPGVGTCNITSNGWTKAILYLNNDMTFNWAIRAAQPSTASYYKAVTSDNADGFFFGTDFSTSVVVDPDGSAVSLSEGTVGDDAFISHWNAPICIPSTAPTSASANPASVCSGTSTNITLTASGGTLGTGSVTQWYTGSCGGTFIGEGNPLVVSQTLSSNTTYYVRYSGTCNTTTCASTTVSIGSSSTAPTTISGTTTICSGGSTTLTASGGTMGIGASYQWYAGGCGSGSVLGTESSITVSPASNTTYYVRRTGPCNTTACISQLVTVVADPAISTQPVGGSICGEGSKVLSVVASGGTPSLTYQWYNSSGAISGATSSSYTATTAGNYYCIVSASGSGCGSAVSNQASVTIQSPPVAVITGTNSICAGLTSVLSAASSVAGSGSITGYQWYYNNGVTNSQISGATGVTYTASLPGIYSVEITDSNGCTSITCP